MKPNTIVTLVMTTGAEIIGRLIKDEFSTVVIYKPRLVQATQQGVGLVNGISMTGIEINENFEFPKTSVAYIVETMKELADGWTQQTSGIAMPTGGLIK
jgi:hypothetical protein